MKKFPFGNCKLFSKNKIIISGNCDYCVNIVVGRTALRAGMPTNFTFMYNFKSVARGCGGYGSHQAAARCRPVTRIYIHVARIQTPWAMICKTITNNACATMGARKIFNTTCK